MISGRFHLYAPETRNPAQEALPYVKTSKKRFIIIAVAVVHGGALLLPLLYLLVKDTFKKPPLYVMHVPVVESVPGESSPHPSPARKKSSGIPDQGPPQKLEALPEIVKLLPEPAPVQKRTVQKKPRVTERPVPAGKRTVTLPKQAKVTRKAVRKHSIKVSTKRVRRVVNTSSARDRRRAMEAKRRADLEAKRRADLAARIRSLAGTSGGRGSAGGGGRFSSAVASPAVMNYYGLVDAYLRRRWNQPRGIAADDLQVVIRFRVDKNGRILFARVEKRSGNSAMDYSVDQLIRSLNNVLPAPPSPLEFTVSMEIDR